LDESKQLVLPVNLALLKIRVLSYSFIKQEIRKFKKYANYLFSILVLQSFPNYRELNKKKETTDIIMLLILIENTIFHDRNDA
jgi:hypothetical protein